MYPEIRMEDLKKVYEFLRTRGYSKDTINNYRRHLERFHRWLTREGGELSELDASEFMNYLDEQTTWGYSQKRQALSAVKAFVRYSIGPDHPVLRLRVKRARPKLQRTLTADEVKQVLASIDLDKVTGIRNYAMVALMVDTGLRASEVCRLAIKDISLEQCLFQVLIKGGRYELAVFTPFTRDYLAWWLEVREGYVKPGVDTVFIGIRGGAAGQPMTRSGLKTNFMLLAKKAEVEHFSPHALRRTMATLMIGENQAPNRIAQISGRWQDGRQVEHYSRALGIEEVRPFLAMNAIIGEK